MPKRYIPLIADTQLDKRLYGLEETRQDWFNALHSCFAKIKKLGDQIAAIAILGDIFDTESVGSEAAYALQRELKELEPLNVPILLLLGNHDVSPNPRVNWIDVCKLVNRNVRAMQFDTQPFVLEEESGMSRITFYGGTHLSRGQLAPALQRLQVLSEPGEHWLLLHQALAELAPHEDAWDIRANQVPEGINRVFLGDFHNHCAYQDPRGIEFVYPGAIETVSFNQKELPGFLIFDRMAGIYKHEPTRQREYITLNLNAYPEEQWEERLDAILKGSADRHEGRKPVARLFYPALSWEAWDKVRNYASSLCLKLFDLAEHPEDADKAVTVEIDKAPETKEEAFALALRILEQDGSEIAGYAKQVLLTPDQLKDIAKDLFPKATFRENFSL